MAVNPVESYLEARHQLDQAANRAEAMAQIIRRAADALIDWTQAHVSNVPVGFPGEVGFHPRATIDAKTWPTAQQLAEALIAWHNAQLAVLNAWDRVPADRRSGLVSP